MKSHTRVVVIGGGVVGVSTLYHLARQGIADALLVERQELTSGSTWHAAGLLPLFNMSYSVGQIHKYSVKLYGELEKETGQHVGFTRCSNIRLARTRRPLGRVHVLRRRRRNHRHQGQQAHARATEGDLAARLDRRHPRRHPAPRRRLHPARRPDPGAGQGGAGAGRGDPPQHPRHRHRAGAFRRVAGHHRQGRHHLRTRGLGDRQLRAPDRRHGRPRRARHPGRAPVHRHRAPSRRSRSATPRASPRWGCCARPTAPGTCARRRAGCCSDPTRRGRRCCYVDGPAEGAEYELFQEDLERLEPHIETAIARVPAFGEVGIKKVYNGAIAYTPDGSPIIGPASGRRNFWLNEGHSFGVTAAGGAGWQLAHWIAEGEPSIDMMGVDPRRFGPYASEGYLKLKNEEAYANVFTVHYPDEERAAARPLKTAPCYGRMAELGAVFGTVYGWERPGWFAPKDYGLDEKALDKPDTLLNHNHAPAAARRPHQGEMVVPALQLLRHGRRGMPPRQRQGRAPGHVGVRQDGGVGPEGARMARLHPRQPHSQDARPHRALPPAHALGRGAGGVHGLRMAAGAVLPGVGGRLRTARPRHAGQARAARRLGDPDADHQPPRRAGARGTRGRARCCRSSPPPISPTRPSRGSRARRSRSARAPRMRCG